jgi:hypothetical protein
MSHRHHSFERHARVQFCGENAVTLPGFPPFVPDATRAYVEFGLSHAFPVITVDNTAIHPQVVANSYRSMLHQVFNLAHLMKAYDPERNPRDRILGSVVGVTFPETPAGGWRVQGERSRAPGIRAVAVMHKKAESVQEILRTYASGDIDWTVSMEQLFEPAEVGFAVHGRSGVEAFEESTPEDLRALGWTYVPPGQAEAADLYKLFNAPKASMRDYRGQQTIALFGGLNGTVHYNGAGLTPIGKEDEAFVAQMLAGGATFRELTDGTVGLDLAAPLRAGLEFFAAKKN